LNPAAAKVDWSGEAGIAEEVEERGMELERREEARSEEGGGKAEKEEWVRRC
jgi:hypothetical protein